MEYLLLIIGILCLVIFVLAKFMKPILKASISIIALLVVIIFTLVIIWMFIEFGLGSLALFGLLILCIIGEVVMLVKKLIDKIPNFNNFFKGG